MVFTGFNPYIYIYIHIHIQRKREKGSCEKHNFLRKRKDEFQPLIRSIKTDLTGPPLIISTLPWIASILHDRVHRNRRCVAKIRPRIFLNWHASRMNPPLSLSIYIYIYIYILITQIKAFEYQITHKYIYTPHTHT